MRNKRLLAALLATVMVAGSALTGCGASSSQAAGGESAGGGE